MLIFRRALMGALVLTALGVAVPSAMAQGGYPSRPIVLINPYAVGGPADLLGRALAKELGEALGQSVVVENKAGGGASIGAAFVAKAAPDGTVEFHDYSGLYHEIYNEAEPARSRVVADLMAWLGARLQERPDWADGHLPD